MAENKEKAHLRPLRSLRSKNRAALQTEVFSVLFIYFCFISFRTSVFVDPFTEVDEQLAKERAEELAKTREKEQNLMAKKKQVDPAGLKAYSKGVGKFINPNLKKKAQKIDDEDLATPVVKKKKQIKKSMNDFSGW